MAAMWALVAVGAGADEGTSWVLATGPRADMAVRARLARGRDGTRLPGQIGALTLVPVHHPAARRARRDLEVTTLAI